MNNEQPQLTRAEIARRNGALSKGPKTEAGKQRAAQNAVRHGLTADKNVVLQNENPEVWESVLAAHMVHYNPADGIEHDLVEDIAFCRWRLRRFRGVDTALWDLRMDEGAGTFAAAYDVSDQSARLAFAFRQEPSLHLASRYEGRLRRAYERAIRNLQAYRSEQRQKSTQQKKDAKRTQLDLAGPAFDESVVSAG